jgi:hypothetical protein
MRSPYQTLYVVGQSGWLGRDESAVQRGLIGPILAAVKCQVLILATSPTVGGPI